MTYDIAIIGAGMAGASLAAELDGRGGRVLLIEGEALPGYHATGRSAAFWTESYGGPLVQPLTTASGPWLAMPPAEIAADGFLAPRGALHLAAAGEEALLADMVARFPHVRLDPVDRVGLDALVPGLAAGFAHGLAEPSCADIDVARLHAACLAKAKRDGVVLHNGGRVVALDRVAGRWRIGLHDGTTIAADRIVNAAGAWAGEIARMAGAAPIAITPYRRTIVQLAVDPPVPPTLPLVIDAGGRFYFKPDAGGRLWLSPHDETPSPPGDAAPDELDVAIAIDRLQRVVEWRIVARERAWAGLRSFAPDRAPVYGDDPAVPGFFWFAGQGGFGIQTAPAGAMIGAALLTGDALPPAVAGIDVRRYAPGRFGSG